MRKRALTILAAVLLLLGGGTAYAAGAFTGSASCTPSPAVTYGPDSAEFTQTCSVPLPPAPTVTVTATQTVTESPSPTTTTPSPTTTDPQPATLKPRVAGLVVTDPAKLANYNGVITNAMEKGLTWADLEPTQGTYNWAPLHKVLDSLPAGAHLKVVVDSGTHAPQWVKDWGSVDVVLSRAGTHGQVPYFWTDKYVTAYNDFQTAMAAEFDSDPRLLQVVYAGTMTENSEPFTLGGDDASGVRLYNAGFRWDAEKTTMRTMLTHMLDVWHTTHVEFALHGAWQYAVADGIDRGSWSDIEAFIDPLVQTYGSQLVTADYGLGPNDGPPDQPYAYMAARGANSGYQLTVGSPYNADTRAQAVKNAIDMGGSYCEHAAFSDGDGMTLQQMNDALVANSKEN